jgi:hypothetical protein
MKNIYIAVLSLIIPFIFLCCSTSQFTMYKPEKSSVGWRIEVEKSGLGGRSFDLIIDGQKVLSESFSIFGKELEATGNYQGKKIKMFGYRNSFKDYNGNLVYRYQIRVIIDDVEITTFEF